MKISRIFDPETGKREMVTHGISKGRKRRYNKAPYRPVKLGSMKDRIQRYKPGSTVS